MTRHRPGLVTVSADPATSTQEGQSLQTPVKNILLHFHICHVTFRPLQEIMLRY